MKIAVIGTGYVGLVTGTCFAETGNHVICVDIDEKKVQRLSSGEITIYEPGLGKLFERNLHDNRLIFTTDNEKGVKESYYFSVIAHPPRRRWFGRLIVCAWRCRTNWPFTKWV